MGIYVILGLMYRKENIMSRDKIDNRYKWDLSAIYRSIEEFNEDYNKVKDNIDKLSSYEDKFMDDAENFYNALKLSYDIDRGLSKLHVYSS